MPNIIANSESLQVISFIVNVVFITYELTTFFREKKHKKELANIFSSEYKATQALAGSIKDASTKLQVGHLAEFLKAVTRNLTGRRYDEVGGDHHNFLVRWIENFFVNNKRIVRVTKTGGKEVNTPLKN